MAPTIGSTTRSSSSAPNRRRTNEADALVVVRAGRPPLHQRLGEGAQLAAPAEQRRREERPAPRRREQGEAVRHRQEAVAGEDVGAARRREDEPVAETQPPAEIEARRLVGDQRVRAALEEHALARSRSRRSPPARSELRARRPRAVAPSRAAERAQPMRRGETADAGADDRDTRRGAQAPAPVRRVRAEGSIRRAAISIRASTKRSSALSAGTTRSESPPFCAPDLRAPDRELLERLQAVGDEGRDDERVADAAARLFGEHLVGVRAEPGLPAETRLEADDRPLRRETEPRRERRAPWRGTARGSSRGSPRSAPRSSRRAPGSGRRSGRARRTWRSGRPWKLRKTRSGAVPER